FGLEYRMVAVGHVGEVKGMDGHRTRLDLDRFAASREIVGALATDLDRRVGRRPLHDLAGKARQAGEDRATVGPGLGGRRDGPVGIVAVGLGAPADGEALTLQSVLDEGYGLGGVAELDRENAGCERIEGPRMTDL